MRPARVPVIAPTLAVVGVGLSACFTTAADFGNDAESYILDNEALRAAVLESSVTFTAATCAEPKNQNVGTTFTCTATDSNGSTHEFRVEITGSTAYEITLAP